MFKKGRAYIVIGILTLVGLLLLQYNQPKTLNWFPSFVAHHKIPFGTYVFHEIVDTLLTNSHRVDDPPYKYLSTHPEMEGTYFFVNGSLDFEEAELDAILQWVHRGNTVFMASEGFPAPLLDTLDLEIGNLYNGLQDADGFAYKLMHPDLRPKQEYTFEKSNFASFFRAIDTLHTTVLGTVLDRSEADEAWRFSTISKDFGNGKLILSTFPKAFTNYFMLHANNRMYTAGLLSYVPKGHTVYLDQYYKKGKAFYTSPMYIFLNNKSLKWAYYLALIGCVFYLVFEGKRKQRAIPILPSLKNQTLAFTRTIADMYYEKSEQKEIAIIKITYFLEYIRSRFHLGTYERGTRFYRNLAARSSHTKEEIENLFSFIKRLEDQNNVSSRELTKLNQELEKFKHRADGRS